MTYLTSKELSEKWGIGQCRIIKLAREGRIQGAKRFGKAWLFPEDAVKPVDGRTIAAKESDTSEDGFFRYPCYIHRDIFSFNPPLSEEELILKSALEAFHACSFEEADSYLGSLPETAKKRYDRINSLYVGCWIDFYLSNTERFFVRYTSLQAELRKDFPHKLEMKEYIYTLDLTLFANDYYANEFHIEPEYAYDKSFLPHLAQLCAMPLSFPNRDLTLANLKAHEMNCILLEETSCYDALQDLHLSLGNAYGFIGMKSEMTYHYRKAFQLAEKYDLYFQLAAQLYYMKPLVNNVLSEFSTDFIDIFNRKIDDTHNRHVRFMDKLSIGGNLTLLPIDDYIPIYYAIQGYTNKQVAALLHVSESTVGKKYSEIYATTGAKGKKELIDIYKNFMSNSFMTGDNSF